MPDPFEALAVGLNEDSKARRRTKKADTEPAAESADTGTTAETGEEIPETEADIAEDGAHVLAIERMENLATDAILETRSLVFDARDFLLDQIKSRPKPFGASTNAEQRDIASACEHAANELVRKMVEAIASDGREPIRALLESYTEKDGIKVVLKVKTFTEDEALSAIVGLHKAAGKHVLITVASADDYKSNPRDPETDADQPGLFEAEVERAPGEYQGNDDDLAGDDDNETKIADALAEQQNAAIEAEIFESQQPE